MTMADLKLQFKIKQRISVVAAGAKNRSIFTGGIDPILVRYAYTASGNFGGFL